MSYYSLSMMSDAEIFEIANYKDKSLTFELRSSTETNDILSDIADGDKILICNRKDNTIRFELVVLQKKESVATVKMLISVDKGISLKDDLTDCGIKVEEEKQLTELTENRFKELHNRLLKANMLADETENTPPIVEQNTDELKKKTRNLIVFGAPGTGKSYKINKDSENLFKDEYYYERVTFHPDYSYANFVGAYKPKMNGDKIEYGFVPGPFMRILKKALAYKDKKFLLIIEEINRANPAAVFGDVFQLLDRDEDNKSDYHISPTKEMIDYLSNKEDVDGSEIEPSNITQLRIPSNMFIWATMNSADQGVFPMDTAFKRRWEFEYLDINNGEKEIKAKPFVVNNITLNWNELRKAINDLLSQNGVNEDKLLGPFFISPEVFKRDDKEIIKVFKSKVLMYLFEDAAKLKRDKIFSENAKDKDMPFKYSKLSKDFETNGINIFNFSKEILSKHQISIDNNDNSTKNNKGEAQNNPADLQS